MYYHLRGLITSTSSVNRLATSISINSPALNCNFRPRRLDAFCSSFSNNTCRFGCILRASIVQAVYITETKRMPQCYQHRFSQKNKWSNDQLQAALKAVQEGELKPHRAAVQYGIPPSTLYDHLKGKSKKRYGGPPTVLTCAEEKEIAMACEVLQQFGYPLTTNLVGAIVRDYVTAAERPTLFRNSILITTGGKAFSKMAAAQPEKARTSPKAQS